MFTDKDMNSSGENKGFIFLDHYTYGLHPQELGHGIKAYTDEENKRYYESILENVINSVNYIIVNKSGEVRIFYISKEKAITSLVTPNGVDAKKRKGIYSHNIVIDLQDYFKLGVHPAIFEKYFIRDINLRGKIERLQVALAPKYEPSKPIKIPVDTVKNVLSTLLKGQGVKIICRNKDTSTVLKMLYFLLDFLPPTERLVPYITAFPAKNQSSYKLIIMQEDEYLLPDKEWITFKIDEVKDFSPRDPIDETVNYIVDSYYKKGYEGLEKCHKLWQEIRQKNPDIGFCARTFLHEINIREKGIQSFLEETIKKPESPDMIGRCDFIIDHLKEIPSSERFKSFLSLGKLKLSTSKENIDTELRKLIEASSIFSKKEQLDIIISLGNDFPNYKPTIYSYIRDLEKEQDIEFHEYIKNYPDIINGLDETKRIEYIDDLPLSQKIEQYYNYFKRISVNEIVEMLHKDGKYSLIYKKSLITLYEYIEEPKYRNNEVDEKVKSIIKKIVDVLDKTLERKPFQKSIAKKNIATRTIERLLSLNVFFILLYCLKHFNLEEYVKKLERIAKEYIGVIFSLNDEDIKNIFLNV
jgi:hypothetical protein